MQATGPLGTRGADGAHDSQCRLALDVVVLASWRRPGRSPRGATVHHMIGGPQLEPCASSLQGDQEQLTFPAQNDSTARTRRAVADRAEFLDERQEGVELRRGAGPSVAK